MIIDLLKIFLFIVFFNWTISMHAANARATDGSQKIITVLLALTLSLAAGIVVVL